MSNGYDPLSEYHLNNPELKLYEILDQIRDLIDHSRTRAIRNDGNKKKEIIEQIQNLLTEPASKRILQMLYRKNNIKYDDKHIEENDKSSDQEHSNLNASYKNPNILLQVLFLSAIIESYALISQTLDIDLDETKAALEYLKATFKFDDPLVWLQNFIAKNSKHRRLLERNILLGQESSGQAADTAEERKLKKRRLLGDSSKL